MYSSEHLQSRAKKPLADRFAGFVLGECRPSVFLVRPHRNGPVAPTRPSSDIRPCHCARTGPDILFSEQVNSYSTEHLGCFKDTSKQAIPSMEGLDPLLVGSYKYRRRPFIKCAVTAFNRGFEVFGIKDGGQCFTGPHARKTYAAHGVSHECRGGYGGGSAIDVYKITGWSGY